MARGGHRIWGDGERLDVVELADMLQSVLLDNADAILVIAEDGTILAANPAAEVLFGRLAGELVGSAFGHPVSTEGVAELSIKGPGGVRIAEMHVGRTRWQGDSVNVATFRDISERRAAEQRLRDFVSIASHELRTPATSIVGFAGTLTEHYDVLTEDERRRSLAVIHRHAKRLVHLATDLLELARLEDEGIQTFPRLVPLRTCVDAAIEVAGVDDVEVVGCDDIDVFVDDEHLVQILVNYLSNAEKYGAPPVRIEARPRDGFVDIVVIDHGEGVPPEFQARLFTRFARASSGVAAKAGGTGLGLALVAALAALNGGEAFYRPNAPTGSQFGVSTPTGQPT